MALNTRYAKITTACTAASGATNKVTALVGGLFDAIAQELSKSGAYTPAQQNQLATARAHCITNIASFQTSIGL